MPEITKRFTNDELRTLEQQILDAIAETETPVSARNVFYRMTDPTLPVSVDKTEAGYSKVSDRLKQLRRSGALDYDRLVDTSRSASLVYTYASARAFAEAHAYAYRTSPLAVLDYNVIMWCESRSLAGMIADIPEAFGVSLYPAGGFTSMTFAHECARSLEADGRPAFVLYFGDYDTAGTEIDRSILKELNAHTNLVVEPMIRIGINPDQIEEYNLPTKPGKDIHRRDPGAVITATVEAEAMPAPLMRRLVREAFLELVPEANLAAARLADEAGQEALLRAARRMRA